MDKANNDSDTEPNEDKFKSSGQIVFRMTEFKAFSVGRGPKTVTSDTVEHINGLPWRIQITYRDDCLGFYLCCDGDSNDMARTCQAAYQLSVLSLPKSIECITMKGIGLFKANFCSGWKYAKFGVLLDPQYGIYDEEGDAVTFKARVTAERPSRGMAVPFSDNSLVRGNVHELGSGTDDEYKRNGQILFRMADFKAFSECQGPTRVASETVEHINGLPWRIVIQQQKDYFALFLRCDGNSNDMAWSCRADYQFSVVSSVKNECLTQRTNNLFTANNPSIGRKNIATFAELMDPKNGIYDEKGDAVTFKAQITAEKPRGMPDIRTADPLLVNGKVVYVNKHNLSMHSEFFHKLFFGPMAEQLPNVPVDDVEDAMKSFERLLSTMPPQNLELDDDCVENVLHLADRFMMDSVENRCVNFLMSKSKKSAVCKFRLAHQYSIIGMKDKILGIMTKEDFLVAGENHYGILLEHDKMDAEAARELRSRYDELFGKK